MVQETHQKKQLLGRDTEKSAKGNMLETKALLRLMRAGSSVYSRWVQLFWDLSWGKSTALQTGVLDEQVIYFLVDHTENKQEELEAG